MTFILTRKSQKAGSCKAGNDNLEDDQVGHESSAKYKPSLRAIRKDMEAVLPTKNLKYRAVLSLRGEVQVTGWSSSLAP